MSPIAIKTHLKPNPPHQSPLASLTRPLITHSSIPYPFLTRGVLSHLGPFPAPHPLHRFPLFVSRKICTQTSTQCFPAWHSTYHGTLGVQDHTRSVPDAEFLSAQRLLATAHVLSASCLPVAFSRRFMLAFAPFGTLLSTRSICGGCCN